MKIFSILALLFAVVAVPAAAQQVITTGDAAVLVPDNSAGVITACQSVTAVSETIADLNVQFGITHTWVGDLTVELRGPVSTLTILNRPGRTGTGAGNSDDLDGTGINFSDSHPTSAEDMGDAPLAGVVCTDDGLCEFAPAPDTADAPNAGLGTDLADFNGTDAVGTWDLCVADSAGGDTGTLVTWTLGVNARVPVELESFSIE